MDLTPVAVYKTKRCELWHGSAESVLPLLPKRSLDLLVADPPYGANAYSNRGGGIRFGKISGDDGSYDPTPALKLALSCLRNGRHAYVFGPRLEGLPLGGEAELIWDKGVLGMGDLTLPWAPRHERISFGVYCTSKANAARGDGRLSARLRQGSVLSAQRKHSRQVQNHPTEKPVGLLRQLVESSSCLGEVVLDPFAGSGSTGVAAVLSGRRCVLIELDERYVQTAAKRLSEAEAIADAVDALM